MDGPDILRDIFTRLAIATGGRQYQYAAFITQIDGQPVKLEFAVIFDQPLRRIKRISYTRIEVFRATGFGIGLGANGKHGDGVAYWCKTLERFAAYTLGR